ncbi:hypothetical protein IAU60_003955 [Kwoniella sp. DSM 27419]
MSRARRSAGGAVRGPASALTSFLAGLGVEPPTQLTTWGDTSALSHDGHQPSLAHDGPVIDPQEELDPAGAVTARTVIAGPSDAADGTAQLQEEEAKRRRAAESEEFLPGRAKRARGVSVDSDDLDAVDPVSMGLKNQSSPSASAPANKVAPAPLKAVGDFMECGECTKRFTVTAYTKEHPSQPSTYLCVNCCYTLGIDPFAKPKKASVKKKVPGKKEDRAKLISQIIGKYIEDVDQLGDIGGINMDKVCKIICKGRRLTPETAPLFYSSDRQELEMYDCTNLTPEAFISLGRLCPNLRSLHLHLCGQLSTEAVSAWAKSLKKLKRLELFAPFLVRKDGWLNLFTTAGKSLEGFLVTQSPRIDRETIETMVKSCPNLTELRLAEIGLFDSECLGILGDLKSLKLLDIRSPGSALSDDAVIDLLRKVGQTLETLDLSDNPELTDEILPVIATHCPQLRRLSLRNNVELTNEGLSLFFNTLLQQGRPGLEYLDLEKGHDLQDQALKSLVDHSGKTVEKLCLLGWREVSASALSDLTRCGRLRELDLGWCRQVTDFTIKDILENCQSIETVRVWGCNQLTDAVPRKKGVKVIGIETHSI